MASDRATGWLPFPEWGSHGRGQWEAVPRDLTGYRQDTGAARVISTGADVADVVRLEDEMCLASQDRITDGSEFDVIGADPAGGNIRHIVQPFTVGRDCLVSGAEVQLRTQPFGELADSGSAWLAIYSATNADFTPGASRTLIGVIGKIHNHRISYLYWQNFFVPVARGEIALTAGTNYFLCICADDPDAIGPDQWVGTTDAVLVEAQCYVGGTVLYQPAAVMDFPNLVAVYNLNAAGRSIWYRLYEHRYTLNDLPLVTPGSLTTPGDLATVTRVSGIHGHYEIDGPMSGQTARGSSLASTGGGGGGGAITYDPTAVIYADAAGVLTGVATAFSWDGDTLTLTVDGDEPAFEMYGYGNAAGVGRPIIRMYRSRGTVAIPAAVQLGDILGYPWAVHGYDGGAWRLAAFARMDATELWGATRGANVRFWQIYTGAAGVVEWMNWAEGQIQLQVGSAALPSYSFLTRTTDGMYSSAAGSIGFASGGVAQWIMSATALYPFADNSEDVGTATRGVKALFLSDANVAAPAAEGELRANGTRRSMQTFIGGDLGNLDRLLYSRVADATQGGVAEVVVATYTIPAANWAAGKVYHFAASGEFDVVGGATTTVRVRIGGIAGTVLVSVTRGAAGTVLWRLSGELVCRTRAAGGTIAWGVLFYSPTAGLGSNSGALNTTIAQDLVITHDATLPLGGNTTVRTFEVWEA